MHASCDLQVMPIEIRNNLKPTLVVNRHRETWINVIFSLKVSQELVKGFKILFCPPWISILHGSLEINGNWLPIALN